jgi:hypothetical protein
MDEEIARACGLLGTELKRRALMKRGNGGENEAVILEAAAQIAEAFGVVVVQMAELKSKP